MDAGRNGRVTINYIGNMNPTNKAKENCIRGGCRERCEERQCSVYKFQWAFTQSVAVAVSPQHNLIYTVPVNCVMPI